MTTRQTEHLGRITSEPSLPPARGPLSGSVLAALSGRRTPLPSEGEIRQADPYGDDLQLLLYVLYELHYRGFEAVDEGLEWDPALLRVRAAAEGIFLSALRAHTSGGSDVRQTVDALLVEPVEDNGHSVSHHLQREGERWQIREYAALRSLYHLKEADPHLWVVPRLRGRAKAAMVAIEFDEFGAGRAENIHAQLFADLMADLDLDTAYGRYLEEGPAQALATVNLMSLFGLHRSLRGALVGHFAAVEVTSSPGSRRMAKAMRRVGAGAAAQRFYDEHVEADAVHEQLVRRDVIGGLLEDEPYLAPDIVLGIEATGHLEYLLADHLLSAWRDGSTALRTPLGGATRPVPDGAPPPEVAPQH
ncbi:iron-containing redox enzyme family protein [Streptomyces sp. So13.3]|uniref:iron-containing redox enzyme family protein n=1 Tax=Streptomyces TaxID=1883 RepID=UPI00110658AF|nr:MULTISPECIES: iron-containing redox enzyme family protein [Streptomyces]MCZ4101659.1 iron-containing redox enzyme family protein [Streptomyces sp. H39-C1]QNA76410.1 iron-containing redox enzyme family protein [Streptomyces sp. So13.3]